MPIPGSSPFSFNWRGSSVGQIKAVSPKSASFRLHKETLICFILVFMCTKQYSIIIILFISQVSQTFFWRVVAFPKLKFVYIRVKYEGMKSNSTLCQPLLVDTFSWIHCNKLFFLAVQVRIQYNLLLFLLCKYLLGRPRMRGTGSISSSKPSIFSVSDSTLD